MRRAIIPPYETINLGVKYMVEGLDYVIMVDMNLLPLMNRGVIGQELTQVAAQALN